MPNFDLPILVVDDAKFSSMVVSRALAKAGYDDVRIAHNAPQALELMEQRPVGLLIADWLMPEMDGLELTDRVRQIDEQEHHYTYVMLLTARESVEALAEAFDRGVDDFVYKSEMNRQLLPRVFAADRITDRQNSLLSNNALLEQRNQELQARNIVDVETGLYNNNYAGDRLERCLRQADSRGGACAYLLVGIRNWNTLKAQYLPSTMKELATTIGQRLEHLVRPMDSLCRIADNQFAIVAYFDNPEHCTTATFRRIHDGINHQALKTSVGYISLEADMVLCRCDGQIPGPGVKSVQQAASQGLANAHETRLFTEVRARVPEIA
ncbi:response regulator [Marinobacter sp. JSM 1782161]|uniref:GGDEF domain-containing response regulator n=1 Tax=Marinobacter sp. JSM 1782161 TaxID=2685906 RepID=UPI001403B236|nr:response regulator [Marinobacter sp. JSM 1782161]